MLDKNGNKIGWEVLGGKSDGTYMRLSTACQAAGISYNTVTAYFMRAVARGDMQAGNRFYMAGNVSIAEVILKK